MYNRRVSVSCWTQGMIDKIRADVDAGVKAGQRKKDVMANLSPFFGISPARLAQVYYYGAGKFSSRPTPKNKIRDMAIDAKIAAKKVKVDVGANEKTTNYVISGSMSKTKLAQVLVVLNQLGGTIKIV